MPWETQVVSTITPVNAPDGPPAPAAHDAAAALLIDLSRVTSADASRRRRAEYSSDASNYRVVPQVVTFPRDADDDILHRTSVRVHEDLKTRPAKIRPHRCLPPHVM